MARQAVNCTPGWAVRAHLRYHLQPFDLAESARYIKHHLRVVDAERCPFYRL